MNWPVRDICTNLELSCAASSVTSDRASAATCFLRVCSDSSTAGTTQQGSPSSRTGRSTRSTPWEPSAPPRRGGLEERPPARLHRHRSHPLGHPRPRDRGERSSALGHLRARAHRAQRHRGELDRAARPAARERRQVHLRDRRRGGRPSRGAALRGRPRGGSPSRLQRPSRPLRLRGHLRRLSRRCSWAPARSARWWWESARARASSPRRSRPSWPRPATCSSSRTARSSP